MNIKRNLGFEGFKLGLVLTLFSGSAFAGTWFSVTEKNFCEALNPASCRGAYGFTVFNDGSFQAGPFPDGHTVKGKLSASDIEQLKQRAAAVAADKFEGDFNCGKKTIIPGIQDILSIALTKGSDKEIYKKVIMPTGSDCTLGNSANVLKLHDEMERLMNVYYPPSVK